MRKVTKKGVMYVLTVLAWMKVAKSAMTTAAESALSSATAKADTMDGQWVKRSGWWSGAARAKVPEDGSAGALGLVWEAHSALALAPSTGPGLGAASGEALGSGMDWALVQALAERSPWAGAWAEAWLKVLEKARLWGVS